MCGIFGLLACEGSSLTPTLLRATVDQLFKLSESRGKESSGVASLSNGTIGVYKRPIRASLLVGDREYRRLLAGASGNSRVDNPGKRNRLGRPVAVIGHTRLVTNGVLEINQNNQPVIKSGLVGVHNGIVVNDEDLWKRFPSLRQDYTVDTEVILALIRLFLKNNSLTEAVRNTFRLIRGSASIAVLFEDIKCLMLATNTGSLYTCVSEDARTCLFASEAFILKSVAKRHDFKKLLGMYEISQVMPGSGLVVDIGDLSTTPFSLDERETFGPGTRRHGITNFEIVDFTPPDEGGQDSDNINEVGGLVTGPLDTIGTSFDDVSSAVNSLRRCTRCVLPETVPFIKFDEQGVCSYCRNYRRTGEQGEAALEEFVAKYRSKSGDPDCIVTFSGGRDSSYGLHYIKNILKMNPVAYSYDWGMITDLARRNQARLCGKLGVEHIWVSADIKRKREYIRKNVQAWFKKPDLGIVPLFMAGDKQYFYYANRLKKQTGIKLVILCENPLEKTDFKAGFCGIRPRFAEKSVYSLPVVSRIELAAYYARQYLLNPAYLNASLPDTLGAFFSYYLMPHGYLSLYRYIRWDEQEIMSTLIRDYDWEVASDTRSTWRIGDGTAAFYNYIYYTVAGFTENDTFRSNQIREGMITREQALELVQEENRPRYDSIQWYCDTIAIDIEDTLRRINSIPRLYPR